MLLRGLLSVARLNAKGLGPLASSNTSLWSLAQPNEAVSGGNHGPPSSAGSIVLQSNSTDVGRNTAAHISKDCSGSFTPPVRSGVEYLYQALGLSADSELVTRIAGLWSLSPGVLGSTAAALASLLQPCGRDTTAHALWMLVRCPALRYWSEQQLHSSFAHLQQITSGAQLSHRDFTTTVYRHPWMLNAAAATAVVRRTPRVTPRPSAVLPDPGFEILSGNIGPQPSSPPQQQQLLPSAPFYKSLAMLLVQAQAFSTSVSSNSSDGPPYVRSTGAEAAVKAYATISEAAHEVTRCISAVPERLASVLRTAADRWIGPQQVGAEEGAMATEESPDFDLDVLLAPVPKQQ